MSDLLVRMGLDKREFDAKLEQAQRQVSNAGRTFGRAASAFGMTGVVPRLASVARSLFSLHGIVLAGAGALALWFRSQRQAEQALIEKAAAAGIATRALQQYASALGEADPARLADDLARVSTTLRDGIAGGAKEATEALRDLGVETAGQFRTADQHMQAVLDRVKELGRSPEAIAQGAAALGVEASRVRELTETRPAAPMSGLEGLRAAGRAGGMGGSFGGHAGMQSAGDDEAGQRATLAAMEAQADAAEQGAQARRAAAADQEKKDGEARVRLANTEKQVALQQADTGERILLIREEIAGVGAEIAEAADDETKRTEANSREVERLIRLRADLAATEQKHAGELLREEERRTSELERQTAELERQSATARSLAAQELALRGQQSNAGRLTLGQLATAQGTPSTRFGRSAVMAARQAHQLEQAAPWMRAEGQMGMADAAENRARSIRGALEQAGVIQRDPAKAIEDRLVEVREQLRTLHETGIRVIDEE